MHEASPSGAGPAAGSHTELAVTPGPSPGEGEAGVAEAPARDARTAMPGVKRRGRVDLRAGRPLLWWVEMMIVVVFDIIYETVRNWSTDSADHAFDNGVRVVEWERALGMYWEPQIQRWALHYEWLIVAANYYYGSAYIIVTIASLVFLYRRFPDDYRLWRNTLLVGTLLALIGFATFPLMPPRLLDRLGDHDQVFGYLDTLVKFPTFWSFDSGPMKSISNQFAAMPSLHCGWALWAAAVFIPRVKHWWAKLAAALHPMLTLMVVVVTANHYLLDALGGAVTFAIGYGVARLAGSIGRSRVPSPSA